MQAKNMMGHPQDQHRLEKEEEKRERRREGVRYVFCKTIFATQLSYSLK